MPSTERPGGGTATGFVHQACIYDSDEAFVATALPFVTDGLRRGEPVLVTTTPANLDLLADTLGAEASQVDYAETAYFGRRPPQRMAAFHRYWRRHAGGGHARVRVLAEPVWAGRSPEEVAAWTRMESGLNELLAGTGIWMICPYDARALPDAIVADARRTHPERIDGTRPAPCPEFTDPAAMARSLDAAPLPQPPPNALVASLDGDLRRIRHLVAGHAAGFGLDGERARMLLLAVNEAAATLAERAAGPGTIRTWTRLGAIVVDLHQPGADLRDPFAGLRPPASIDDPAAGLWLASQVCDSVDIRRDGGGTTIRLSFPGPRAEEPRQPEAPYTG